ncbi:PHD finger family protein [Raphanus sativus]|uniref:DDT domain-containing protein PTM isoform X1 n=2 Tax=Raphanus sativus TaxID=3726 RepID=A0A6J0MBJ8_RAPSA|nr:DDT domain-containing protein PTM isoform X1 [Raphanus sativus]XP_018469910.2 DDT domain-containing protein PTM isoform X1 [Raphanus sativus]XP_056858523.1 DDT domain-containing protein PTM isoform X1 [Raphanus sativus]XP_056858524.1 DDT domain-containing protein PTM isoform X1 [Raphanus sativus]KAJ4910936.1 PHD finger family protein [Raphanus sativus]
MEGKVARPRGRPRKRPRPEDQNRLSKRGKRPVLEINPAVPRSLLGSYVLKEFDGSRVSLGKVVSYSSGLYRVEYEDGGFEDLRTCHLRQLIVGDGYFDDELRSRRCKLDDLVIEKEEKKKTVKQDNQVNEVEVPTCTSSSSGSGAEVEDECKDIETMSPLVQVPPVDLPWSSGTFGIPEEAVVHLLSVYGFLRSFSVQLYIYPFGLDDFVGALNFLGPNSLLDAVHVSLLRALKVHLERLSSQECELASNCLRCIDWSLLDALTWPVYLVQYFSAMGHASGPQWSVFSEFAVEKEYYSLPVVMKLKILQILCDDVFDVADIRAEIDTREESEVGYDPDGVNADLPESGPRRVHPRFAKTSARKEKEHSEFVTDGGPNGVSSDLDGNSDECRLCGMDGTLLCCDGCPLAYHSRCIGVLKMYIPDGPWYCPECTINKMGPTIAHKTSLRGAVDFGVDPHGRLFLGTCNHLIVLKISVHADADVKYYTVTDIPKVVLVLLSATNHRLEYLCICKAISEYWDLPGGVISHLRAVEANLAHMQKEGGDEVSSDLIKPDNASSSSRNNIQNAFGLCASTSGHAGGPVLGKASGTQGKNVAGGITHKGLSFKPHAYINHYSNGELATSAAAALAVLLSEETHEPDQPKFSNAKKAASSHILLQVKAFSLVASSFFWPSPDKKEITRERCGWCHSCKLTSASKRGCMLNAAVTGATKSAMKIFSGIFPLKNGEGVLCSIAAYILYIEESLRGLIAGPFLSESLRKQWRKKVEEASTCKAMKALLLELEENICSISLSSDWLKLMDDWLIEHSIFQSAPVTVGATQKRGPGKRKQRNQAEVTAEGSNDDSFTWWRGGKLSKVILLKAVLLKPMIRKAAWQGGLKKFPEFNYGDGSYIPKRSRRSIWKAAVESSKNISQLALQVRYLDTNIRWSELVRPEQNLQDVKGPETEATVFRNASIRDKMITDNKVRYGVAFGNQKHLPSRVMKNVIEVEKTEDGNEKFWFAEARVPLYLTKEYEESLHRVVHVPFIKKPAKRISKLQKKQLKASRANIFCYLASRRDNTEKCSCASCHLDVLLRDATICSACGGFCHKGCTMNTQHTAEKVDVLVTCKRCHLARARSLTNINHRHPTTPSVVINGQHQNAVTPVIIKTQIKPLIQQLPSSSTRDNASGAKQTTPDSNMAPKSKHKTLSWGIIWRKKNLEDTCVSFRQQNILLAGRSDQPNPGPICGICKLPYNPALTYIHCTICDKWYHIEAIKLEESKIPEVAGFKCCKCRRIRSPECPYMDPVLKEQKQMKNVSFKCKKHGKGNTGMDSDSEPKDSIPSTPSFTSEDAFVPEDYPLLVSVSKVEQITPKDLDVEWKGDGSVPRPQKLPVRRQMKREDTTEGNSNLSYTEFSTYSESHPFVKPEMEPTLPAMEWNASENNNNMAEGELMFDYEDMEFEPQTYFSLTELLTTDDDGQCNGYGYDKDANTNPNNQVETIEQCREFLYDDTTPCQICMHVEPGPDLTCHTCNMTIHSHCSPWEEESACAGGSWRCGRCREWM